MIKIREAIVVEGRYDQNKIRQIFDTVVIEVSGFGIFSNHEKLELLRKIAEKRGLLILTDSDGAGFVIRNYLKGALPQDKVKHAYIPDIYGKERRKAKPSCEGKLGVEGVSPAILVEALKKAGISFEGAGERAQSDARPIAKSDLYEDNFSGRPDSAKRRKALLRALGLPEHLSGNALLDILNAMFTREEYKDAVSKLPRAEEI